MCGRLMRWSRRRITKVRDHPSVLPKGPGKFWGARPAYPGCCRDCAVFTLAKELVRKRRITGQSVHSAQRAEIHLYIIDSIVILVSALGIEPRTP
jgi:hypothetical protein